MTPDTRPTSSAAGVDLPTPARPTPLGAPLGAPPPPAPAPDLARALPPTAGQILVSLLLHALVIALAVLFLTPLGWSVMTALKSPDQFATAPMALPRPAHPENFADAFYNPEALDAFRRFRFAIYVLNTVVITQLVVLGTVLSSSLVAYGFARFDFRGKKLLFGMLISTMLLPGQVTMIPVFSIWSHLGLVDTIWPLVIPAFLGGGAFNVFLLRQFYMQLPRSLDEAAMIDGCTPFGIWWRILVPLSKPSLITVGLFSFTHAWEDFMGPLIYLQDPNRYTVSIGLRLFNDEYGGTNLPLLMASGLLHIAPMVILFLVAQKYFVRGIATSGLKD